MRQGIRNLKKTCTDHRQTNKQTNKQTDRQTDKQTNMCFHGGVMSRSFRIIEHNPQRGLDTISLGIGFRVAPRGMGGDVVCCCFSPTTWTLTTRHISNPSWWPTGSNCSSVKGQKEGGSENTNKFLKFYPFSGGQKSHFPCPGLRVLYSSITFHVQWNMYQ